jgi:anti-anti-sigma factor
VIEAYEAPAFSVEVSRRGAVSTVAIRGELDISTEPELLAVLAALEPGYETLVVDLSECAFFASSGISMLLDLNTRGARDGFRLVIIKAPPEVQRIFDLASLDKTLTFRDGSGPDSSPRPER